MRKFTIAVSVLCLALLATAFAGPGVTSRADDPETQLGKYMHDIKRDLRELRGLIKDPAEDQQSLALIRALQLIAVQAKAERPALLAEVPEAEQEAFLIDYARGMCGFLRQLIDLEELVLAGDNEAAVELRNEINKLKTPAHEKFKAPEEE